MTPLQNARNNGITVWSECGVLAFDETDLCKSQVDWLRTHKQQLLTELQAECELSAATCWKTVFEAHVALLKDGRQEPSQTAIALAWDFTLTDWLNANPERSSAVAGCAYCGGRNGVILPYGIEPNVTWLHDKCWHLWSEERERHASQALQKLGIAPPSATDAEPSGDHI